MAARAAGGLDAAAAAACFGRSAAVACVRTMVKRRGSETAENDGRKLVNVARPRCQRSLPGRGCYPAYRCRCRFPPPKAATETLRFSKETKNGVRTCYAN